MYIEPVVSVLQLKNLLLSGTMAAANAITCTPCTSGTYQTTAGQTSCSDCTAGHECSDPTLDPVPCAPGEMIQRCCSV